MLDEAPKREVAIQSTWIGKDPDLSFKITRTLRSPIQLRRFCDSGVGRLSEEGEEGGLEMADFFAQEFMSRRKLGRTQLIGSSGASSGDSGNTASKPKQKAVLLGVQARWREAGFVKHWPEAV